MIGNAELLPDHHGDSLQGPEIVGKTVVGSALHEQIQEPLAIRRRHLARTSGSRFGLQCRRPPILHGLTPPTDRGERDSNTPRHLLEADAALHQGESSCSTLFQCLGRSCGSHSSWIGILSHITFAKTYNVRWPWVHSCRQSGRRCGHHGCCLWPTRRGVLRRIRHSGNVVATPRHAGADYFLRRSTGGDDGADGAMSWSGAPATDDSARCT